MNDSKSKNIYLWDLKNLQMDIFRWIELSKALTDDALKLLSNFFFKFIVNVT